MRTRMLTLLATLTLAGCLPSGPQLPPPYEPGGGVEATRLTLAQGEIVGTRGRYGGHAWLGVPYARPPVGPLRWRAPQPPEPAAGTLQATAFPPACFQQGSPLAGLPQDTWGELTGQEDCLHLNVFAPETAASADLPVMMWIHGGGYTVGWSGFYDGSRLASEQNVVVVTINYRLGPLGWFRHPALRAGADALDASGNFGTLDTIRALEWISENIGAFGGDPGNVTVFGESAGGHAVLALLTSPLATGLFHRAIVESGSYNALPTRRADRRADDPIEPGHPASGLEIAAKLWIDAGRAADRADALAQISATDPRAVADFLRSVTPQALYTRYDLDTGALPPDHPRIFADGTVLAHTTALDAFGQGNWNRMPILTGTNRDEPKVFMVFDPRYTQRLAGLPLWPHDPERYDLDAAYGARAWKVRSVDDLAALTAHGSRQPLFAYRFDWDEEGTALGVLDISQMLGAAHGFEIPFVFGHFDLGPQTPLIFNTANAGAREALSAAMRGYWAEFARSGQPGRGGRPDQPLWHPYGAEAGEPTFMVLDTAADGGIRMSSERDSMRHIARSIAADPHLEDQEARCRQFARAFRGGERVARVAAFNAIWRTLGDGGCGTRDPVALGVPE